MKYTPKHFEENVNVEKTSPLREFFLLLFGVIGALIVLYMALGMVAGFVAARLPVSTEERLFGFFDEKFLISEKKPNASQIELQKLLDRLTALTPQKRYEEYNAILICGDEVNAAALPGGNIIIYEGLLKQAESENEIALVLAHELGHFSNRDHLRGLGRILALFALSAVVTGSSSSVTEYLGSMTVGAEMRFSQKQEYAADDYGFELVSKLYGGSAGTSDFFDRASSKDSKNPLVLFFRTHPASKKRADRIKKRITDEKIPQIEKTPAPAALKNPDCK
ncbi:MAG: Metalloprotease LoiP precursor [bacterium ADurb.Bin236]|nr:MAG: Metalloprotease LoiP precursor [bacterium ADurb.Bin236]